jgi:hypothetical protein
VSTTTSVTVWLPEGLGSLKSQRILIAFAYSKQSKQHKTFTNYLHYIYFAVQSPISHHLKIMSLAKKLIPLLDRVLVEKIVPPAKSVGGVLLPESATQKVKREETCPKSITLSLSFSSPPLHSS